MNKNEFIEEVKKLNINITDKELNDLNIYYKELSKYNSHTNITAIKEENSVYLLHFYDSLTISKVIDLNNNYKILDIGSGAGFPGIVLKIFFPNLQLTVLDSNNKKTKFLNLICDKLNLKDVEVINDRSESYIKEKRNSFDVVTGRAVSHLRILAELSLPFLKNDGLFIAMKGNTEEELEESIKTLQVLNSKIIKVEEFELPENKSKRSLIVIKKCKEIDKKYPRSYNQILQKPLVK